MERTHSIPFIDIVTSLPQLTAGERQAVAARIKALDQFNGPHAPAGPASPNVIDPATEARAATAADTDADMLLDAICDFLKMRGLEFSHPGLIRKSGAYQHYRRRAEFLDPWLRESHLSRNQKRALFALALPLLHRFLTHDGNTIGANQLLLNAFKLPAVLDAQLPGYARAGLLGLAVKQKEAP